jgi:hypothetical protein
MVQNHFLLSWWHELKVQSIGGVTLMWPSLNSLVSLEGTLLHTIFPLLRGEHFKDCNAHLLWALHFSECPPFGVFLMIQDITLGKAIISSRLYHIWVVHALGTLLQGPLFWPSPLLQALTYTLQFDIIWTTTLEGTL